MKHTHNVKSRVIGAFRHLLVPLVRVLLRNAVGFHEFTQIVKEVYVQVCAKEFCSLGASMSSAARISVLTGLTRNEIASFLSDDGTDRRRIDTTAGRLAILLQAWHTDPDFVGPYGVPRDLYLEKDPSGLQTMMELVRRYGAGATVADTLRDLAQIDATTI